MTKQNSGLLSKLAGPGPALALVLTLAITLAACGDNTNTAAPAVGAGVSTTLPATTASLTTAVAAPATTATGTTTSAATTAAPSAATTAAATTRAATTAAAAATTVAAMPGHNMGSMTTAAGTVAAGQGSDPMTESLKGLSGAQFETRFMQFMIGHHQSAIDMAKLAPANTKRPELLKLSQEIITAQSKEISEMTGWLAAWHNARPIAASDHMSIPGMMSMMGEIDRLKKARDADFDKQFISMMIEHHQQAVNMAKLIPGKTQRSELLKLGQDIIKTQTAEIEQMQGWQKAWFPA